MNHYDIDRDMNLRINTDGKSSDNILMCQIPRIYRRNDNSQGIFSQFMDIVISGREIMEISKENSNLSLKKMLEVDGLYQLRAEIK